MTWLPLVTVALFALVFLVLCIGAADDWLHRD